MPRPKQMTKRSVVEFAKARRNCKFMGEAITKSSILLVVYDGPRDRSVYSGGVGHEMIKLARERINEFEGKLPGGEKN